jgi:hypothetical protein
MAVSDPKILVDHVVRRGLQNHLQLLVLVQTIRILPIAAVRGSTARLNISDAIWFGPKNRRNVSGHMVPAPTSTS